ncbi:hypothetical protein ACIBL6_29600 [Streptomyces sp. NPDC050400]|uniref:hypothetical protein n=1 Tax=Streptomyces sp. NPDC050400 TaxID=3365610 RepID=UPI0037A84401
MRKTRMTVVALSTAVAAVVLATAPVGASTAVKSCKTSDGGAQGALMAPDFTGKKSMRASFGVKDTKRGRDWVRVRVDITTGTGRRHSYSWHENRAGYGKSKSWTPRASHDEGIVSARIQVENRLGSQVQDSCFSGKFYNPYY